MCDGGGELQQAFVTSATGPWYSSSINLYTKINDFFYQSYYINLFIREKKTYYTFHSKRLKM